MTDITRDQLAEVVRELRAESTSFADVRVELANVSGALGTLNEAVRLQISALATAQSHSDKKDAEMERRVTRIEQWQWKVAGAIGVLGILAGSFGSTFAERL